MSRLWWLLLLDASGSYGSYLIDVKQAFIQADLHYDISMELPDVCRDESGEIVKLNKAVYGFKQAGRYYS